MHADREQPPPVAGAAPENAPVRWGVLGAARIALEKVVPAMQRGALTRVEAIASRDPGKARAAAEALGIPRAYGSYEELIADPDIEAVYNPLPNHMHVPWSIRAAEAGKHVLCEKPIALTAAEARTLLAVRNRMGVQVAEAFMVRAHPQWQRVRDLVAAGRIGDLRLVVGHYSYNRRLPNDIRNRPEWGGGGLMDIGCYLVMISRWVFGAEPLGVLAAMETDPELGVDRLASIILRFASGQASLSCGTQLVPYQRVHLLGTRGRLEVEIPFNAPSDRPCRLVLDDGRDPFGGGVEAMEVGTADQFTLQAERFSAAVRGMGTVPVSLEDSIGNMAVLDALFRSADSGRWEAPTG